MYSHLCRIEQIVKQRKRQLRKNNKTKKQQKTRGPGHRGPDNMGTRWPGHQGIRWPGSQFIQYCYWKCLLLKVTLATHGCYYYSPYLSCATETFRPTIAHVIPLSGLYWKLPPPLHAKIMRRSRKDETKSRSEVSLARRQPDLLGRWLTRAHFGSDASCSLPWTQTFATGENMSLTT